MQQDEFRTRRARELRREMTPTEKRLWLHLRGRRFAGLKFRRQTPLVGYIVDFYFARTRLVIELDGAQHLADAEAYRRDRRKDALLQQHGFFVLRFLAEDVGKHLDHVIDTILATLVHRRNRRQ